ncbi:hypothetical protein F5Y09DRAFT_339954 [Xylaria sp. FL1042]|nr:hypothetical protein F5Y09DRAFT_339954 [Xylaria sp. FL1042]
MSDFLLERQLHRFFATGHPNTALIEPHDLKKWEAASSDSSSAAPAVQDSNDVILYPLEWAESRRKFRTFLKNWRKRECRVLIAKAATISCYKSSPTSRDSIQQSAPTSRDSISSGVSSGFSASYAATAAQASHLNLPSESSDSKEQPTPSESFNSEDQEFDTDESTIQLLADLTIHSPHSQANSPEPAEDSSGSSTMTGLSAEDAAQLIAAAFDRQKS